MEDKFGLAPAKRESVRRHFYHSHFLLAVLPCGTMSTSLPHQPYSKYRSNQPCVKSGMASETRAHLPFWSTGHKTAWSTPSILELNGPKGLDPVDLETPWVKLVPRLISISAVVGRWEQVGAADRTSGLTEPLSP